VPAGDLLATPKIGLTLRWPVVLLAGCGLAGCGALQPASLTDAGPRTATVYVVERSWHTDIALPAAELDSRFVPLVQLFPGVRFLVFGFGERAYLLSHDRGVGDAIAALFPSPSAMLVTALSASPEVAFDGETVVAVRVTPAGLQALSGFIADSFADPRQPIADGPYPGSLFYAAVGTYDLAYTCNTWTAEGLRAAGLPVRPGGVVFASQVMGQLRPIGEFPAP
jgi:uncharacterized protein (TIGR02117 family)